MKKSYTIIFIGCSFLLHTSTASLAISTHRLNHLNQKFSHYLSLYLGCLKSKTKNSCPWEKEKLKKAGAVLISIIGIATGASVTYFYAKKLKPNVAQLNQQLEHEMSVEYPDFTAVTQLIRKGANANYKNDLNGPLILQAVVCKDIELLTVLLEKGANPNTQGRYGYTALHILCHNFAQERCRNFDQEKSAKIAQLLIKYKANPDMKNTGGMTPMDLAQFYNIDPQIFKNNP